MATALPSLRASAAPRSLPPGRSMGTLGSMPKLARLAPALLLTFASPLAAQGTGGAVIRGRVVDAETGAAIAAAKLAVHGRGTVYTGRDGRFELPALARGAYDLDVGQLGYYE